MNYRRIRTNNASNKEDEEEKRKVSIIGLNGKSLSERKKIILETLE